MQECSSGTPMRGKWQRHLEQQEDLHVDDMALPDICNRRAWHSCWRRIELWEMFKDLRKICNRKRIENRL